jgi:hypothetical protein
VIILENGVYKLKLKRGDLEIEAQGDKEWVEKKFLELAMVFQSGKSQPAKPQGLGLTTTLGETLSGLLG